ncbi:MAG TPA: AI-2E family transporter [Burkholderiales bacterium]
MTSASSAAAHEAVPDAAVPAAAAATVAIRARPYRGMSLALGFLAVIAFVAALYLARAFFVPLLIGILASYALRPVVDWLEAHYLPRPVGAALALVAVVGSLSWVGYSLRDDTAAMIEKLPEAARKLRQTLSDSRESGKTPLQNMQEAANEIQGAAADAALKPGTRAAAVRTPEPSVWLRDYAIAQSRLLITVAAQAPIVLLLAYFLLASGVHFRRKLVQFVGPSLSRKKDAVRILEEIDVQVQRYLLTMLMSNALVAIATWLAFEALGMEHAGVWGVASGVLHFIPYLGSALIVLGSGIAAYLQFGSALHALATAGVALLVAGAIGHVFMTWLQSRAARVNAAVLFIALLFFGWLWGIWGLLLGAPLVAIVKTICDRVEALKPVGELLGR